MNNQKQLQYGLFIKHTYSKKKTLLLFSGEFCNPDPNDMIEGRYRESCPCDNGLNCKLSVSIITFVYQFKKYSFPQLYYGMELKIYPILEYLFCRIFLLLYKN